MSVPAPAAQEVVNELAEAGVKAILNFAPARLETPPGVKIRNVDLAVGLGRPVVLRDRKKIIEVNFHG